MPSSTPHTPAASEKKLLPEGFRKLRQQLLDETPSWGPYPINLNLEAVLLLDRELGTPQALEFALETKKRRKEAPGAVVSYEAQPFCCPEFILWRESGDDRYLEPMFAETRRMVAQLPRGADGIVLHPDGQGGLGILVDSLQDYASRCTRAGVLDQDDSLIAEALQQWLQHEALLRDPHTGLWAQGQGWLKDPLALSPGAWSRGQGWLVRGLTQCLDILPEGDAHQKLCAVLNNLAHALDRAQAPNGLWHRLCHRPPNESLPDSSGSGMIYHALSLALRRGWLEDPEGRWPERLQRAWEGLGKCIDAEGHVLFSCPGHGPLESEADYLGQEAANPVDESHGRHALLLAAAAHLGADRW